MKNKTVRDVVVQDRFFAKAQQLRSEFDQRFSVDADPAGRFVWDMWHVPNQYRLLRTPARNFFSEKLYDSFHQQLAWWGRDVLGCHDVSPIWMSSYTDGCFQNLHGDLPHGPFAFVFSLTNWSRRSFSGGETLILKDRILNFWQDPRFPNGLESDDVFERIEPRFGRLVVFDPRRPHGVAEVKGALGVEDSRLVLHGWFIQPRPFVQGPLRVEALSKSLDALSERLGSWISTDGILESENSRPYGLICLKIQVEKSGKTSKITLATDTINGLSKSEHRNLILGIRGHFLNWDFRSKNSRPYSAPSVLTVPLSFE